MQLLLLLTASAAAQGGQRARGSLTPPVAPSCAGRPSVRSPCQPSARAIAAAFATTNATASGGGVDARSLRFYVHDSGPVFGAFDAAAVCYLRMHNASGAWGGHERLDALLPPVTTSHVSRDSSS